MEQVSICAVLPHQGRLSLQKLAHVLYGDICFLVLVFKLMNSSFSTLVFESSLEHI